MDIEFNSLDDENDDVIDMCNALYNELTQKNQHIEQLGDEIKALKESDYTKSVKIDSLQKQIFDKKRKRDEKVVPFAERPQDNTKRLKIGGSNPSG